VIAYAKGWYQHLKATVPAVVAAALTPYHLDDARRIAMQRLSGRTFGRSGRVNFMMVVSVVNWETTLMEHARAYGACHHLDLGARGFFESAAEWRAWRAANFAKVEAFVSEHEDAGCLNVLFLYLSEFHLEPTRIEALRSHNVVILNFNWDDVLHYRSRHRGQSVGVRRLARMVDLNLSMSVTPLSRYASDGSAVFYWYGIRKADEPDPILPPVEYDRALFFGSRYGYRAEVMDYLTGRGLPLDVYGAGWGTGVISYEELAHRIPRYALNLGVSSIGYAKKLCQVKGRDIEVPMAGGLYLTNDSAEIRHIYEPEKDILTYRSLDHCYRQASAVLEHPANYAGVRARGAKRAQWFSWDARFRYLVELLFDLTRR
jgi:hypothetical protein